MAMKRIAAMLLASVLLLSCVGCARDGRKEPGAEKTDLGLTAEVKPATDFTAKANAAVYDELDFDDKQEYEFATRGLIDAPEALELKDEDGTILWSQEAYAFLDDYEKAPDSVNPSLWENTKNNHAYGLFEVTDGIYQVRGYDMANLTVVKGDTGWIVFDTLMSVECSQAAMQLIEKNFGKFPVKAVIISHSHADHFGGIAGVMAKEDKADETLSIEDQLASGKIPVITPVGFTEHSVKENVYAGKGMGRRSNYQYGILLTPGVTGKLAQGIGMGQSTGTVSFMTPSYEITQSGEKLTIDGVELEFQLTPGTEAPRRNEHVAAPVQGALDGGKLHRHAPQSLHAARRGGARRRGMGKLYHRGHFPLRQGRGGHLPVPQLAALGKQGGERLHGQHGCRV